MRTGLIAKKLGMTSLFDEHGVRIPVTFVQVRSCQVVGKREVEKDGYSALILGSENLKSSKVKRALSGLFTKFNIPPKTKLKEFRVNPSSLLDVGVELGVNHFILGQFVDISGTTIGKGFAGVMKRHNFKGLEASHGVSISHRSHGSTGGRQDPGKVFKGKKMAGHMGCVKATVQNLKVLLIDSDKGVMALKGSIPGAKNSYVYIRDAVKKHYNGNK